MRRTLTIIIGLLIGIGLSACAVPYYGSEGYYGGPHYSYGPAAPGYGYYPFSSFSLFYSDVHFKHRHHHLSGSHHRHHRVIGKRWRGDLSDRHGRIGLGQRNQRFERGDRSNRGAQFRAERRSGRFDRGGTASRSNRFRCSGPRC